MNKSREFLEQDLDRYAAFWECEPDQSFRQYRDFVQETQTCCERSHLAGHCTGSAFVISPDADKVLLLYHPFLQRWLQPGGHADGSFDLQDVAQREAHEETGLEMDALVPVLLNGQDRIPFDLDIHPIPERPSKGEPAHFHYDLRFLFVAFTTLRLIPETEEMKVEWVKLEQVASRTDEESVLRMVRKLKTLKSVSTG